MYDNHINLSFLSKIRVLLVSLHDTASANRVRKIPRSGTVRGVLRTTLIASARAMPGSYPGELVSVSIPRNLTNSTNICSKPQATWEGYSTNICIKTQQRGYIERRLNDKIFNLGIALAQLRSDNLSSYIYIHLAQGTDKYLSLYTM